MENELPDYLVEGDGYIDITLRSGLKVSGVPTKALRLREPTLNDQLVMEATKGSDAIKEATLLANLCGISVDEAKTLTLHDYKRVMRALGNFIG